MAEEVTERGALRQLEDLYRRLSAALEDHDARAAPVTAGGFSPRPG
jgi:hypothetical protein